MQLSLPHYGIWVRFALLFFFLLRAVLGQNANHSCLTEVLAIEVERVWRYTINQSQSGIWLSLPSMTARMEKPVLTKGSVLSPACPLSSEHDALASTCVPMQDWLSSSVYLSSALSCTWFWSCPSDSLEPLSCSQRSISRQAISLFHLTSLNVWIVCPSCLHNCLISSEYDKYKCLEGCFTNFIELDFKPFVLKISNRLAPASFPLTAEEEGTS